MDFKQVISEIDRLTTDAGWIAELYPSSHLADELASELKLLLHKLEASESDG